MAAPPIEAIWRGGKPASLWIGTRRARVDFCRNGYSRSYSRPRNRARYRICPRIRRSCGHLPAAAPRCNEAATLSLKNLPPIGVRCSHDLVTPSPPGEKATARQDQAGQARTNGGASWRYPHRINVWFGPVCGLQPDISRGPRSAMSGHWRRSFDYFIGAKECRGRNFEPDCLGSLHVEHKLET